MAHLMKYVHDQLVGGNETNRHFQSEIGKGCQNIYDQLQALVGAHLELKKATVALAKKNHDMATQINDTSKYVSAT
jgi:hypothetical protein